MTIKSHLPWCPDESVSLAYSGKIREAKFGQLSSQDYQVWECATARLGYLHPFPVIDYTDDSYRLAVNDSAAIEQYFALHASQQPGYLNIIKDCLSQGITVADFGCGGGALLDLVKKETQGVTVAVEPFTGYHKSLKERGHLNYNSALEYTKDKASPQADLALSFHVIEHTINPVEYLREIYDACKPGAKLVVVTPNLDDVLVRIDKDRIASFFYRKVHNYYFTAESLAWVGKLAGWNHVQDVFYHEFGLANTLNWLRDTKPSGNQRCVEINQQADLFWKTYLESNRLANNVGVVLQK